jgi:hypothetical protein
VNSASRPKRRQTLAVAAVEPSCACQLRPAIRMGPALGESTPLGVVLLSCGHLAVVIIHPGKSIGATLKGYDWECPDTGATVTATRVLTVLSEAAFENMGQEAFDLLVSTGAAS